MIDVIRSKKKSLSVNPTSLILELYLNSLLGTGGYTDGADVTTWPDQSGHSPTRDALAVVAAKMTRSGAGRSLNNSATVTFNGIDAPSGSNYNASSPNPEPAVTNGYTFVAYGRLRSPSNSFGGAVLWQNQGGLGPQIIYSTATTHKWAWRDNVATPVGDVFSGPLYGMFSWVFNPPSGSGNGVVTEHGPSSNTVHLTNVWTETDAGAQSGYYLGANQVGNVACDMDLCAFLWASSVLSAATLAGLNRYFIATFG